MIGSSSTGAPGFPAWECDRIFRCLRVLPLSSENAQRVEQAFVALAGRRGAPTTVPVMMGRSLAVPEAQGGVCRFKYRDLCQADVFAADFKVRGGGLGQGQAWPAP